MPCLRQVYMGWNGMGSRSCQRESKIIQLYGYTSKVTKHLTDFHRESSSKSLTEQGCKRSRHQEINRIADTIANTDDSRCMTLLLETLRIQSSILRFLVFGEYEESELIADLVMKEAFRATINRQTVSRAITELYGSSRRAASNYILTNCIDKLYGSPTDAGPDVKWMMRSGLCLKCMWCVSHLAIPATKTPFGIAPQRSASKNPELTDLISRIAKTINTIRSNDSMVSLFVELCQQLQPDGTTQLLVFIEHLFMGLTRVIRHILEKWAPLEHWFEERREKAIRVRKDPLHDYPLIEDNATLTQLLGLLDPVTTLNIRAQSECANQVEVLLNLYRLRLSVLDKSTGVKDRFQPPNKTPFFY
ncbi:LOW QUALITY PROTEIN: hypothetical protein PHPALM_30738 [Phytophthora palmivora]|uniref:Uncharacterized protein n=1 Tax=Phytophthora palmivora TaxID=4796 RepID=A0A2P4X4D5_9STRA|nr:LOW QUALITY PROTEIN: hypothetical protein PHPALM_30738 [Phytophthora palmivora]